MTADLPTLLAKYRNKGIVLDSNLLVLLFVGLANPDWIREFKHTSNQEFTEREFSLLSRIVEHYAKVIATPHILTEVSNYICQLHDGKRQSALGIIAEVIQSWKERSRESKSLVKTEAFHSFGLTDSAILDIPPKKYLVLSIDLDLVVALQKKGVDAINFNHLRQLEWE